MHPTVLIVAGEASADEHGAQVMLALRALRPLVACFGAGGAAMRAQGLEALVTAESISVAGLTEVVWALPRLWLSLRRLTAAARTRRPHVALLIDLPDFNLRLARRLRRLGVPVVYYISPQVWAWRVGRVAAIRATVDRMLVILPFEAEFYARHGVAATFVGHPLTEQLPARPDRDAARRALRLPPAPAPVVALLPGSRAKEVLRHLPAMLAGVVLLRQQRPDLEVVVPVASTIAPALVQRLVDGAGGRVHLAVHGAAEALAAADAAVVCSGTATLQAALLVRPMVVVYRVSWLSYAILRRLVKVAHIALVNLIAGEAIVPELVQGAVTAEHVARELGPLLQASAARARMAAALAAVRVLLGQHRTGHTVAVALLPYVDAKPSEG